MKNLNVLLDLYYSIRSRLAVIKKDLNTEVKLSLIKRIPLLLEGFVSEEYVLYSLGENKKDDFLNDYQRSMTRFINEPYSIILNDKILFQTILSNYLDVPETFAWIKDNQILSCHPEVKANDLSTVIKLGMECGGLVIKPVKGASGEGVKIIKCEGGKMFLKNREISEWDLQSLCTSLDNYIITRFIKQGAYASEIFPDSSNTIRVLTMIDPETQEPFIPVAVQRIGTKMSAPLDNFLGGKGGISSKVNIETGELGPAVYLKNSQKVWSDYHPDTSAQIKGVKIPNWAGIKTELLTTLKNLPYLKYIGWDILVTDEGFSVIEANNHSGIRILQVHEPILKNPRVRKFYQFYGIL